MSRSHRIAAPILLFLATTLVVSSVSSQTIPDVDAESTPLHWAAEEGLISIARGLLANGALINEPDQFGRTPLHRAVRHDAMVSFLLEQGANPNLQDVFGATPLHRALPYPESVRLLLEAGASVSTEDFLGRTPLEASVRLGNSPRNRGVIEQLIAAGAGAPRER